MYKNFVVIIGGPGVGKTSVIDELARRGYKTINEAAREVIEEGFATGQTIQQIRANDMLFQKAIFDRKLQHHKDLNTQDYVFFDRGLHDTKAYLDLAKLGLTPDMKRELSASTYQHVFALDMLPQYDESDGARTETLEEARYLHQLILDAYQHYGMEIKHIPAVSIRQRVEHIISTLDI
jgi:predicted ATPase